MAEEGDAPPPDIETLRRRAVAYYKDCNMQDRLQKFLNKLYLEQPDDIYGRLVEYFRTFEKVPSVTGLQFETTLDSGSNPAVKCNASATVRNHDLVLGSAQMSAHKEIVFSERLETGIGLVAPSKSSQTRSYQTEEQEAITDEVIGKVECHLTETLSANVKGISLVDQTALDAALMSWADGKEAEHAAELAEAAAALAAEQEADQQPDVGSAPPSPSAGKKKKPSAKGKGKAPAKPVPPKEPLPFQVIGCTAVSVASMALLKSASSYLNKDVFQHLHEQVSLTEEGGENAEKKTVKLPIPAVSLVSAGKKSLGKLNLLNGVMAMMKPGTSCADAVKSLTDIYKTLGVSLAGKAAGCPVSGNGSYLPTVDKLEQVLDCCIDAINTCNLVPGEDVFLIADCAAHDVFDYEKGRYEIITGTLKSADEMVEFYRDIVTRYPSLAMLVDPLRKEDREQWLPLCQAVTEKCLVVGSEVFFGPSHKIDTEVLQTTKSNGVLVTNGGRTTCSDLATLQRCVADCQGVTVLTSSPCDVIEDSYSDLAVGVGCDLVVYGAPSRGENIGRLNRLLEIERKLKSSSTLELSYASKLPFQHIRVPTPPPSAEPAQESPAPTVKSAKKK